MMGMGIKVPPLNLQAEFLQIRSKLLKRTQSVFSSGRYILGKEVDAFEKRFAHFIGTKYAVGVASGSDALLLALMALGAGEEDEVLTTPFSFIATATAIRRLGAKPVFVDVEPHTFNLDPSLIEKSLTKRTRGILLVHLFGNPCHMDQVLSLAKRHKLFVVEDCAQACGATFGGRRVGGFGEFGAFSFYPTKTLGASGDAGAITTNHRDLYEKIKSLRHHGSISRDHSYRHSFIGINSRLDEIQAAILNVKMNYLTQWNEARRRAARRYDVFLKKGEFPTKKGTGKKYYLSPFLLLPTETANARSVYHQYTVRIAGKKRNELLRYLHGNGIQAAVYYPIPLHLQPCFKELGYRQGDFPVAEKLAREVLCLPIYPQISATDQQKVVAQIKKFLA